jgi:hypothetical protein
MSCPRCMEASGLCEACESAMFRHDHPKRKFECHITVDRPHDEIGFESFKALANEFGWKTSYIQGDPLLGDKAFFYFTKYSTDAWQLRVSMERLSECLRKATPVIREKIEEIIYDTKTNQDVMGNPILDTD